MGTDGEKLAKIPGVKGKGSNRSIRKRRAKARNKGKQRSMRSVSKR